MKKKKMVGLFGGLSTTFAALMTISMGMSIGAFMNETDINENLGTFSRVKVDDDPETARFKSDYDSWENMVKAKHKNIEDTAAEGIVLLKNDGVLPMTEGKVNIFGRNSQDPVMGGGGGAGKVTDPNCVMVKEGFAEAGLILNDKLFDFYSTQEKRKVGGRMSDEYTTAEVDPSAFPSEVTASFADNGSTAIIWLARCIGEGTDPAAPFMDISDTEKALIEYVKGLDSVNKIVLVLNEDNPMGIGNYADDPKINAIVHVGGLGIRGSVSLGKVLTGKINPSGHLVDTYAKSSVSSAAAQNMYDHEFDNAEEVKNAIGGEKEYGTKYIAQKEGIYVGYRYYETRYEDAKLDRYQAKNSAGTFMGESAWDYDAEVAFSFGHGLSYTSFEQTFESIEINGNDITAVVSVKNTGTVAGKSVVQLYAQTPYTDYDRTNLVEKSAIQLLGFGKTKSLAANEVQKITVKAELKNLASYDYTTAKTYILDGGTYHFAIGDDAHDALNNVLAKKETSLSTLGNVAKVMDKVIGKEGSVDANTFSKSLYTGNKISNLFDDADYNYFQPGSYRYLTRQDWTTFPTTEDHLTANTQMQKILSGQESINTGYDYSHGDYSDNDETVTDAKTDYSLSLLYGNEDDKDPAWDSVLSQMSMEEMATFTQGNSLTRPIESIGYEGSVDGDGPAGFAGTFGDDTTNAEKLSARVYQSQCMLASTWNTELSYKEGSFMGEDGLYLGKTSIWGPGMNLHRTPYSARNFEYYSEDSVVAYYMGIEQCKGLQDKGCIACPKHFAFNDQEKNRCSLVNFINEQEAREIQLRSFEGAFTAGGALGTMTSFSRIGLTYAGCSHALMTDILRGEWGFKGYTITDYAAWQFMHAKECLLAGTDLFDTTGETYSAVILEAIKSGDKKTLAALREANRRVLYAYCNSHAVQGHSVAVTPAWKAAIIGFDIGLGVVTGLIACAYIVFIILARKEQN